MPTRSSMHRTAGVVFPLLFVALVVSVATKVGVETDVGDFPESLQDVADNQGQHLTSVSIAFVKNLLTAALAGAIYKNLLTAALAGAIYLIFRLHHRPLALMTAFGFLVGAVDHTMVDVANFTLDSLAQQFSAATATEADSLVASARPIALFAEFAFDTGLTFIGLGILLSGILIIRSRAVHHLLRVPAVLGGFLIPLHWLWFLNENLVWIARAGLILTLLYFLLMGIWLIVRGTREAPAT